MAVDIAKAVRDARSQDQSVSPEVSIETWESLHAQAPENPHICAALGNRYDMYARYSDSLPLLKHAVDRQPQNASYRVMLCKLLVHLQQNDDAMACFERALLDFPEAQNLRRQYIERLVMTNEFEKALYVILGDLAGSDDMNAVSERVENSDIFLLSTVYIASKDQDKCIEFINHISRKRASNLTMKALMRISQFIASPSRLLDVMKQNYQSNPSSFAAMQTYFGGLMDAGHIDEANSLRAKFTANSDQFSNANLTLSDALLNARQTDQKRNFLDLSVWRSWQLFGRRDVSWEDWVSVLYMDDRKRLAASQFMFLRPNYEHMTTYLMSSESEAKLSAYASCKGALMAGTHQGPAAIAGRYFENTFEKYASVTTSNQNLINSYDKSISAQYGSRPLMRSVIEHLKNGYLISSAADNSVASDSEYFEFTSGAIKAQIKLSTMIPRLAFKTKYPSFFCGLEWEGAKAKIVVEDLPEPESGESKGAFVKRWASDYLSHLKASITDKPENINAWQPIWSDMIVADQSV